MSPLSLEQAPPLSAPARFFLTGPIFGVAAGLLLAARGDEVGLSRWSPAALAVVHLLVLGFMLQIMAGALLQLLPVAAGAVIRHPRAVAWVTHLGLSSGTVLLVAGFLGAGPDAMAGAAVTLGLSLGTFIAAAGRGLVTSPAIGPTLLGLRLAVLGLSVTVALGLCLAGVFAFGWALPVAQLVAVHAAWGLVGWALLLVMAVATLVVPMFQLTPAYAVQRSRLHLGGATVAMVAWTVAVFDEREVLRWGAVGAACAVIISFSLSTFQLQSKRKRRVLDATFWSWRIGVGCLLVAALVGAWLQTEAWPSQRGASEYLLGVLLLGGAFPAVINGMLYKIVPFLGWLHLQRQVKAPPHMNLLLPEAEARWHFRLSVAALATLSVGAAWSPMIRVGGALLAVESLALEVVLVRSLWRYRRELDRAGREAPRPGG